MNTCQSCRWSFETWAQTAPDKMPTNHLRCWPGGDRESEQVAEIACLKFTRLIGEHGTQNAQLQKVWRSDEAGKSY